MSEKKSGAQKRKRVVLTIKEKIDICNRLDKGENRNKLMEEYGIGSSTIYDIRKQRDELLKFYTNTESKKAISDHRALRKPKLEKLDSVLYEWFVLQRSKGAPLSGPILIEKAKDFYRKMELTEECAFSDGWLAKFKARHGIRKLDISGELKSSDFEKAEEYRHIFGQLVEENDLTLHQIYNADETGLMWRCLPNKTLAGENEKSAAGFKLNKDRLTVLCCANASGTHRIKLLVIGKYKQPRALKNVIHLPVKYDAQRNAWMDKNIFKDWFLHSFVPAVKENFRKIGLPEDSKCILLLDNCSAHPNELELQSGNIRAAYLPPNVTAIIQPMDQGVIQNMKCHYRKIFLQKLVNYEGSIKNFQKSYTIKDALFDIAISWNSVKEKTLQLAWKKLSPNLVTEEVDTSETNPIEEMASSIKNLPTSNPLRDVSQNDIKEWVHAYENTDASHNVTDEDLIRAVTEEKTADNESSDEEIVQEKVNVSWSNAADAFTTLLTFVEREKCYSAQEVMQLHMLHSKFVEKRSSRIRQSDIRDYFKKH